MTPQTRPNPYVGPRAFQYGETLYGRDREVVELLDLLIAERIVLLYSPSGAGKTSLIQAALIPELEKEGFRVLPVMRVSVEPPLARHSFPIANRYNLSLLLSLEEALPEDQQLPLAELAGMELADYLDRRQRASGRPDSEVLIFDQFEEILTVDPTDRAAKEAFFAQVGAALRHRQRWALFAMREEYPAGLDPYLRPIPTRFSTTYRLELLGEEAARLAVQRPARQAGVDFTDAAATKLIDDLRRVRIQRPEGTTEEQLGLYVEPVQLQVVCRRLWGRLPLEATQIGAEDVEAVGDVDSALEGYYAERVAAIAGTTGVRERAIREWLDRHLITEQGMRGQVLQGQEASQGLANRAIMPLVDAHLIRAEKRRGATWFELAHDRLIEPVRQNNATWFQANLSPLQRQAALWEEQHRSLGLLLRGEALEEAGRWAADHQDELTPTEHDFLAACQEARAQAERERRNKRLIIGMLIFAILAAFLMTLSSLRAFKAEQVAKVETVNARNAENTAMLERDRAEQQAHLATSRQLAAQALTHLDGRLDLALLLSVEAYRATDTVEARSSLLTALQYRPHLAALFRGLGESEIRRVAFHPDGKTVASVSASGVIALWDLNQRRLRRPPLSGPYVFKAAFGSDGRLLAALGQDGVMLWDVIEGQRLGPPLQAFEQGAGGRVEALAFNLDSTLLAIGGCRRLGDRGRCQRGEIRLWNIAAGQWLDSPLQGHGDAVSSLAFSPDGQTLASTSREDNSVILWKLSTREPDALSLPDDTRGVEVLTFSPEGQVLAFRSENNAVGLWNIGGQKSVRPSLLQYDGGVSSVAFSPDGERLAVGGRDNTIVLWEVATLKSLGSPLLGHTGRVSSLAFSPDGRWLASGSADDTLILWDMATRQSLGQFLTAHRDQVIGVAFSPDSKRLASTSWDRTIRLWDLTHERPRSDVLNGLPMRVSSVVFSPDDRWLATGGEDQTVILWDVAIRQPLERPLKVDTQWGGLVNSVAFSPDGRRFAWGSKDSTVVLWDVEKRHPLVPPLTRSAYRGRDVYSVAFSPDGKRLAASSFGDDIRFWDAETGKPVPAQLQGNTRGASRVAFSPNGKRLAAASDDGIRLWDAATFQALGHPLGSHGASPTGVAFSPDGQMLASGSEDNTVRLWGVTPSHPIGPPLIGHTSRVNHMAFTPDGRTLASAGADGLIGLWDIHPQSWRARACRMAGRNLTYVEWRQYLGDAEYRATCPELPVHSSLIEAGRNLARSGDVAAAVAIFQRVLELDDSIALDPSVEAKRLAAPGLIERGEQSARDGDTANAATLFARALEWDPSLQLEAELPRLRIDEPVLEWNRRLNLDPQTAANKLGAEGLVTKGRQMANDGDVAGAVALFQRARELAPEVKLDPDAEAKRLAADGLVARGEKLARDGDVKGAIALFQRARALNPNLRRDLEAEASRAAAEGLVRQGRQSARHGKVDEAAALFERARALNPDFGWDPKVEAQELAAEGLIANGEWFAEHGKVREALAAYAEAQTRRANLKISAASWNKLCWFGSLWGYSADVMKACEQAVALDPGNGGVRDSRGLARALTGHISDALQDFQAFINWTENQELRSQRQRWVKTLRAGKNPFTPEVISKLRGMERDD